MFARILTVLVDMGVKHQLTYILAYLLVTCAWVMHYFSTVN